jgi:hypothetical protein
MASDVTICSNALQMLGAAPINSFSEGAQVNGLDSARLCANLWPTTRNAILRSHPWKCAKARVKLSPELTTPAFGYTKRYILPANWLRNVEINGALADEVDYEVETADSTNPSKRLLLSQDSLNLIYIWENTDTESWDAMLIKAAEYAMAAEMAYAVTQSSSLQQQAEVKLRRYLASCRAVDSQDQSPAQLGSLEVLGARRALSYNY